MTELPSQSARPSEALAGKRQLFARRAPKYNKIITQFYYEEHFAF